MRVLYGVIAKPELPECLHPHIEDLDDYELLYLSWQENYKGRGVYHVKWVKESQGTLIKRFKSVEAATSYLEKYEPALLALGCYATTIELEELKKKK